MARPRNEVLAITQLKLEQIVRFQLMDLGTSDIAERMGLAPDTISELIRTKAYRETRDRIVGKVYANIDKVIEHRKAAVILEEASGEAAEALVELLRARDGTAPVVDEETGALVAEGRPPMDPVDTRLVAAAILDRAGYGPVQRKAIRARVELDPVTAKLFATALKEQGNLTKVIDGEAT